MVYGPAMRPLFGYPPAHQPPPHHEVDAPASVTVAECPAAASGGLKEMVGGTWGLACPLNSRSANPAKSAWEGVAFAAVVAVTSSTARTQVTSPALIWACVGGHWALGSPVKPVPARDPPPEKVPAPVVPT